MSARWLRSVPVALCVAVGVFGVGCVSTDETPVDGGARGTDGASTSDVSSTHEATALDVRGDITTPLPDSGADSYAVSAADALNGSALPDCNCSCNCPADASVTSRDAGSCESTDALEPPGDGSGHEILDDGPSDAAPPIDVVSTDVAQTRDTDPVDVHVEDTRPADVRPTRNDGHVDAAPPSTEGAPCSSPFDQMSCNAAGEVMHCIAGQWARPVHVCSGAATGQTVSVAYVCQNGIVTSQSCDLDTEFCWPRPEDTDHTGVIGCRRCIDGMRRCVEESKGLALYDVCVGGRWQTVGSICEPKSFYRRCVGVDEGLRCFDYTPYVYPSQ